LNQRAEEAALNARNELFRIGCAGEQVKVFAQGPYLQMKYLRQVILASPDEILAILKNIPSGLDERKVWEKIAAEVYQVQGQNYRWVALSSLALLGVAILFILALAVI